MITRASQQGLQFVTELLYWDPDKRPNAQQSQRNTYFMNVKNAPSATSRPSQIQQSALPSGRLSIMEVEALDTNGLLSRFSINPKFTSNNDLNEINSLLSVSRLSQNNEKQEILKNEIRSSANNHSKFQSNFNIINDMFNNMKTDSNNNENEESDKNQVEKLLSSIGSPPKKLEEPQEKVNDVFINLLKDPKDTFDLNGTLKSTTSFFLHEPKPSQAVQKPRRNDSGMSFTMLSKGLHDNSFDEGFFDSLNVGRRGKPPSGKDVAKKWDEAPEEDELASILGYIYKKLKFQLYYKTISTFRSKIKSAKRNPNDFKIDDLFGSVSSYPKDTTKYPTTVPIVKATTRNNSILSDLFDSNNDPKHLSASMAVQRRRQSSQQVFVSNHK